MHVLRRSLLGGRRRLRDRDVVSVSRQVLVRNVDAFDLIITLMLVALAAPPTTRDSSAHT